LNFAEGELKTIRGTVKSAWKKDSGWVLLDVTIPGNSTATVFVPAKSADSITESNRKIGKAKEIEFLRMDGGYAFYQVGSGIYHFKSHWE
jgi:alpha-L-rhamnosidase